MLARLGNPRQKEESLKTNRPPEDTPAAFFFFEGIIGLVTQRA